MALILTREHSRVAHGLFMLALIPERQLVLD
jgi:hypothetical protein